MLASTGSTPERRRHLNSAEVVMPKQPLPSFSGDNPTCPKCRNVGAFTKWKAAYRLGGSVLEEECLTRSCTRCEYEWAEALNVEH